MTDVHQPVPTIDDIGETPAGPSQFELDDPNMTAPAPSGKKSKDTGFLDVAGPFLVFGLFIGAWYFMSYKGLPPAKQFLLPPPHKVITDAFLDWEKIKPILQALWLTTKVAILGLMIAIVCGMALAVVMSQKKWVEKSIWPYAVALQCIPILALTPLIGGLMGFNFKARVFVTVIIALFPIISNTLFGVLSVDRSQHELFTLHGVSRWTRLTKLQIPAAMPAIFAGFRISAGLCVIGAVVGDTFFRQGEPGIGSLIDVYRVRLRGEEMLACIILAALLGLVFFWIFGLLNKKAVGHWHEVTRSS